MIAWIDVETTGLVPEDGSLLEVALLATDDDLNPLDAGVSMLVKPLQSTMEKMDSYVRDMHTKSGLLALLEDNAVLRRYEVEALLITYLKQHVADPSHPMLLKLPMGGSSVHFDRAWLKVHMPDLEKMFAYRNVDVSTVKELCQRWAPVVHDARPRGEPAHRAMLDVVASIDELKHYRKHFIAPREITIITSSAP